MLDKQRVLFIPRIVHNGRRWINLSLPVFTMDQNVEVEVLQYHSSALYSHKANNKDLK